MLSLRSGVLRKCTEAPHSERQENAGQCDEARPRRGPCCCGTCCQAPAAIQANVPRMCQLSASLSDMVLCCAAPGWQAVSWTTPPRLLLHRDRRLLCARPILERERFLAGCIHLSSDASRLSFSAILLAMCSSIADHPPGVVGRRPLSTATEAQHAGQLSRRRTSCACSAERPESPSRVSSKYGGRARFSIDVPPAPGTRLLGLDKSRV